ncbi:MAG: phage holin family protein [Alistipes sp.]|nr:phage holin family protein [Alistipes sp.]
MEALCRFFSGAAAAAASFFAPIGETVLCAVAFVAVDFVTGVAADRCRARRRGEEWMFRSRLAWRTVLKAGFLAAAIAMAWVIDACVLDFMGLHTARMLAGFACGVELWSMLENASEISSSPLFGSMRRYLERGAGNDDPHGGRSF